MRRGHGRDRMNKRWLTMQQIVLQLRVGLGGGVKHSLDGSGTIRRLQVDTALSREVLKRPEYTVNKLERGNLRGCELAQLLHRQHCRS